MKNNNKNNTSNPNSKRAAREAKRAASANNLLDLNSDEEQQRSAGTSALAPRPPRVTSQAKKQRTDSTQDMETEPLVPSSPLPPSSPDVISPNSSSQTAAAVPTVANNDTNPIAENGNNAGASVGEMNQSSFSPPLQMETSVSSSSAIDPDPDVMDDADDFSSPVSDDVTIFQASVPYADVVKEKESRGQLLNRIKFYLTSLYPASFKSLRCRGAPDSRLIIATFKISSEDSEFESLLRSDHTELIPKEGLPCPVFHSFDSRALLADEKSRSVVVTDIPLYFKAEDVRAALAKFGTVQKFSIRTPRLSKFQKATCVFTDAKFAQRWVSIWIL